MGNIIVDENTFVLSDLHLGHDKILGFCRPWFKDLKEHDKYIISQLQKHIKKGDKLLLLGDIAFGLEAFNKLRNVSGHKYLIAGNHDLLSTHTYLEVFNAVRGCFFGSVLGKRILFSHIPAHPDQSVYFDYNFHGHLHIFHVDHPKYVNCSCEPLDFTPTRIGDLLRMQEEKNNVI